MTTNEVLAKHNFITKVAFKDGDSQLSKDLKVKIMAMRIEYGKVRKSFDADIQEFTKELIPAEFTELQQKTDRTEEEDKRLKELTDQINEEYNAYVAKRGQEEVTINHATLTEDEYNEIVEVNAGNDVEINGQHVDSADFLEILYSLFVE
jgi:hypothetical protein